jgi:methyl-accepting chemotaxis protein/aerotaxis receptor
MRLNEPITDREIEVPDGATLVSRTDTGGRIVFANRTFMEVSGYSAEELIGAPHNLVRHPHMPKEAFADLWATIKAGRPWEGIVKNRTKQGDFYWVRANVTPVVQGGEVTGYISIRTAPTREQIAGADAAYRLLREDKGGNIGLRDGMLIRRSHGQRWRTRFASLAGRLAVTGGVCALIIGVVGWLGLQGMSVSNQALQKVYEGSAVDTALITGVRAGMRSDVQLVTLTALELRGDKSVSTAANIRAIRADNDRIDKLLGNYMQTDLSRVQTVLARQLIEERTALVSDGLLPAISLAEQADAAGLDQQLHTRVMPLFETAAKTNNKLVDLQVKQAEAAFIEAGRDFQFRFWAAIAMMGAGGLVLAGLGTGLLRGLNRPLRQLGESFDAIGRNDLKRDIESVAAREFWQIVSHLRAMRAKLAFASSEQAESERLAQIDRRNAVQAMAEYVEQEARQAMERVASDTEEMARQADGMAEMTERVSTNAQSVTEAASQALANAQAVGAASEELSASIQEIAAQIGRATVVAQGAASSGVRARQQIQSLSEGALRIGDVVQLIRSVARQTNLLALNATIEAARAGEAGHGFNVVASEVKGLAGQTARSTEEISHQISAIQEATTGAVAVVAELGRSIDEIAQVFTGIAAAIEQQAATTQEIARNVTESSVAAQAVTERITEVSRDADVSRQKAEGIRTGSAAVAVSIAALRGSLVRTIRTATADADRRMQARMAVDEVCTVVWRGGKYAGRMVDMSADGARLITAEQIPVGETGTVLLDSAGRDASAGFAVRSIASDGALGVAFDRGNISPAFAAAIRQRVGATKEQAA